MMRVLTGSREIGRRAALALGVALLAGAATLVGRAALGSPGEEAREIPPPALDVAPSGRGTAVAVLAGGCFWGVQGVYQHVEGVTGAVSGYAGGHEKTADYENVSRGRTDHAEVVRVSYDPVRISYGRLLQIFFSVAHDPTQLDRQGPDVGRHYRSAIFPADAEQAEVAKAYIAQLDGTGAYPARIATRIEPKKAFYPAEGYHQDFMARNPRHPYIVLHDAPKIEALKRLFPSVVRREPILVASSGR